MGDGPRDNEETGALATGMVAAIFVVVMIAVIGGLMWATGTWWGVR